MDRASKYLLKELKNSKDPYFVSIVTYAFHLSEHSEKDLALQKLLSLSTRGGTFLKCFSFNYVELLLREVFGGFFLAT